MKKATLYETPAYYWQCPHCSSNVTTEDFEPNNTVRCPECKDLVEVKSIIEQ
jgi:DNA-directed RNA polymerase subunit RPC12/RpoP